MRPLVLALLRLTPLVSVSASACSDHLTVASRVDDSAAGNAARVGSAPSETARLAEDVSVQEIAVFQGTRVAIARGGGTVPSGPMPVVAGRDALIRVYVVQSGPKGAAMTAELVLLRAGKVTAAFKETITVNGTSKEEVPASTFNFDVPGEHLTADVAFMVRIVDERAPAVPTRGESPAQFPRDGSAAAMGARVVGNMRIVLVPIRYMADGSNRLPDTSEPVLDALRKRMLEFYPVPKVEITVRPPLDYPGVIAPNGNGLNEVLQRVTQLRLMDNAPADVYYYGGFAPAASITQFCTSTCVLGLSNFGDTSADATQHASVGALYATNQSIDTMPHELAHAHGRMHAPCGGASGADPGYPYQGGQTGSWGYSIVTKALKPPSSFDQMSYCNPSWQSDYTYAGLFERIRQVQNMRIVPQVEADDGAGSFGERAGTRTYRMLSIAVDGSLSWSGEPFRTRAAVSGKPVAISLRDDSDAEVGATTAHAYGYDHLDGGYLIVPFDDASHRRWEHMRLRLTSGEHSEHAAMKPLRARFGEHVLLPRLPP